MELLKEQDFSTYLRPLPHSEANKLIEVFNKMMRRLREERLSVREKNHFLDLLIQASPQGVIILDFDDNITTINPAGMRLLNIKQVADVEGKKLDQVEIGIGKMLSSLKEDDDTIIRNSGVFSYRCIRSSFKDKGFTHPFILIEELTHELLKTEKKSYENIIRMMAHEVNNSVGAVSSTLNVISDILKEMPDNELTHVLPVVDVSLERCHHLGKFISNFANVVKIPKPTLSFVNINQLIRSVESLTSIACQCRNIKLSLDLATEDDRTAYIDEIQFEQILINLVKNAYESIGMHGEIKIITNASPLSISVCDNGPGISDEIKNQLFTPFFSTKPNGQGIGLMFVKEVLLNHTIRFHFETLNGWTSFNIYL